MLPDGRENRLAYLLFHCGLNPRKIVRFCSQERSDVLEIYRLRRNMMQQFLSTEERQHFIPQEKESDTYE